MTKHAEIMTDVKAIMETVKGIQKVQFGAHQALDQETTWSSVYIIPGADTFKPRVIGTGVSSYDNGLFVRCIANVDCSDNPTEWCDVRDNIIQSMLKDSDIWNTAVDRDIVSVVYDDMVKFPLMTMEILFEFTLREVCI